MPNTNTNNNNTSNNSNNNNNNNTTINNTDTKKIDYRSPIQAKWCPGCGCYAILKAMNNAFNELQLNKEDIALISGIGCSSRFPYYINTYGFHTIHGRAPTVAMGLKTSRPELSVWVITGDGDLLSIGGNHFIHLMRKNPDINVILFNNEIYGLTKGQASPTSKKGFITKTSPFGTIENSMNAISLALSAGATFAARVLDTDLKSVQQALVEASKHKGISFVEIYMNCITFANNVHEEFKCKETIKNNTIKLEPNKPLVFGKDNDKALAFRNSNIEVIDYKQNSNDKDIIVHNPSDPTSIIPYLLSQLSPPYHPLPLGIFRKINLPTYQSLLQEQYQQTISKLKEGDVDKLLKGSDFWEVN